MYHLKKLIIISLALTFLASQFPRIEASESGTTPAEHLSTSDKLQNAIDKAKTALHSYPDSFELHYHLGMLYTHQRSFKSAIAEYQEAIRLAGDVAMLYTALGSVYSKLNFQK